MNQQQVDRMLDALQSDEEKIRERLQRRRANPQAGTKDW
jgi:hypothetical protein